MVKQLAVPMKGPVAAPVQARHPPAIPPAVTRPAVTPAQARCPSPAIDPTDNNNGHHETPSQEPELKTSSVGVVYFNQPSSFLSPAKECQPPTTSASPSHT